MESAHRALTDTFDELRTLNRESIGPKEALQRVRALAKRHEAVEFDLLWKHQPFDGSVDYDALLEIPGHGSVSLRLSPKTTLPWPLRDVHRYDEGDLLRVNGERLQCGEAMLLIDGIWQEQDLLGRLIDACLLREATEGESVSDEQLQAALDEFRRQRGLFTAKDTTVWMAEHGLDHARLEEYLSEQITIDHLRERVTGNDVAAYFTKHQAALARTVATRVRTKTHDFGQSIVAHSRAHGESLWQAAVAVGVGREDDLLAVDTVRARVGELPPSVRVAVELPVGEASDPVEIDGEWWTLQPVASEPAVLDDATGRYCAEQLFRTWLAERRAEAEIEWYWGDRERTRAAGG
jgi:putative peptide maturation system protein